MASSIDAATAGAGGVITTSDASGVLQLKTAGTTAVTVTAAQNVGIGMTPSLPLDITAATGNIRLTSSTGTNYAQLQAINGTGTTRVGVESSTGGSIAGGSSAYSTVLSQAGAYSLHLGTNNTVRATIDSSGNVGIGTSSGTRKLNVYGGASGTRTMTVVSNASEGLEVGVNASNIAAVNSAAGGAIIFTQADVERMRIDSSGNLIVGATSIIVNGKINSVFDQVGASGIGIKNTNASDTGYFMGFYNSSGTLQGSITQTNSSVTAFNSTSDYRLKNTIAPMTGALEKVALLKPVTYKWNVDGSDGQGFIAHELQAVVPDCVTGAKDAIDDEGKPQYQGIDTSFLVATLTAAIQEQQAMIAQLQADVAALKGSA
jgi:hypothetical protein